jgi:hypothetical protein
MRIEEETAQFNEEDKIEIQDDSDGIIQYAYNASRNLMGMRIIEKLVVNIQIKSNRKIILFDKKDRFSMFLNIFRAHESKYPDLIWNERTRFELYQVLNKEIADLENKKNAWKTSKLQVFRYAEQKNELRVDEIFITLFNKDIYFRPRDPISFLTHLIKELKAKKDDIVTSFELLRAARNLVCFQNITSVSNIVVQKLIDEISYFFDFEIAKVDAKMFSKLSSLSLEIITYYVKNSRSLQHLIGSNNLIQILKKIIFNNEGDLIPTENILFLVQEISFHSECDVKAFFWNSGIIGLLLRLVYKIKKIGPRT